MRYNKTPTMEIKTRSIWALITSCVPVGVDGWYFLNSDQFKPAFRWSAVAISSLRFVLMILAIIFVSIAAKKVCMSTKTVEFTIARECQKRNKNCPQTPLQNYKTMRTLAIVFSSIFGAFVVAGVVAAALSFEPFTQA